MFKALVFVQSFVSVLKNDGCLTNMSRRRNSYRSSWRLWFFEHWLFLLQLRKILSRRRARLDLRRIWLQTLVLWRYLNFLKLSLRSLQVLLHHLLPRLDDLHRLCALQRNIHPKVLHILHGLRILKPSHMESLTRPIMELLHRLNLIPLYKLGLTRLRSLGMCLWQELLTHLLHLIHQLLLLLMYHLVKVLDPSRLVLVLLWIHIG